MIADSGHSSCWNPGGGTAVTQCSRVVIHNLEGTVNRKTSVSCQQLATWLSNKRLGCGLRVTLMQTAA